MNYLKTTYKKSKTLITELQIAEEANQKALDEADELRKQQLLVKAQQ